ncbi:unnamed protein product [Albugo candida]|uniref:Uncharacterized protein n=2 Tax=Albugo candida TaxID=65357 RepID=A0A024GLE3_9STRA|nr:unnamed protein product [Albugo candida]|eukprot:CCI47703.1 unnamed protein product [Albugo candida]
MHTLTPFLKSHLLDQMRAILLQLPLLSCLATTTLGKITLLDEDGKIGAVVTSTSTKTTYIVRFTNERVANVKKSKNIINCYASNSQQSENNNSPFPSAQILKRTDKCYSHILQLAQKGVENAEVAIFPKRQELVMNIQAILKEDERVESVCISLSQRYLSIEERSCLNPNVPNAEMQYYELIDGFLKLTKAAVEHSPSKSTEVNTRLTIDWNYKFMLLPQVLEELITKANREKSTLVLSLHGDAPIRLSHDFLERCVEKDLIKYQSKKGQVVQLGQPFLRLHNVQMFKHKYGIEHPAENEASSSNGGLRAWGDQ